MKRTIKRRLLALLSLILMISGSLNIGLLFEKDLQGLLGALISLMLVGVGMFLEGYDCGKYSRD